MNIFGKKYLFFEKNDLFLLKFGCSIKNYDESATNKSKKLIFSLKF